MLKFLHKFYNHHDTPRVRSYYHNFFRHATTLCGSFWWWDIFKLAAKFCLLAKPKFYDGKSIWFWADNWDLGSSSTILSERFPSLFSFVIDEQSSIPDIMSDELISSFHLPLSSEAHLEFLNLQQLLDSIHLVDGTKNLWQWPFNRCECRPKSYYTSEHANIVVGPNLPRDLVIFLHTQDKKYLDGFF